MHKQGSEFDPLHWVEWRPRSTSLKHKLYNLLKVIEAGNSALKQPCL